MKKITLILFSFFLFKVLAGSSWAQMPPIIETTVSLEDSEDSEDGDDGSVEEVKKDATADVPDKKTSHSGSDKECKSSKFGLDEIISLITENYSKPITQKVDEINSIRNAYSRVETEELKGLNLKLINDVADISVKPEINIRRDGRGKMHIDFKDVPEACIRMLNGGSEKKRDDYFLPYLEIKECEEGSLVVEKKKSSSSVYSKDVCSYPYNLSTDKKFEVDVSEIRANPKKAFTSCLNHYKKVEESFWEKINPFKTSFKKNRKNIQDFLDNRNTYLGEGSIKISNDRYDPEKEFLKTFDGGACSGKKKALEFDNDSLAFMPGEEQIYRGLYNCHKLRPDIDFGFWDDLENVQIKLEDKALFSDTTTNPDKFDHVLELASDLPNIKCSFNDKKTPGPEGISDDYLKDKNADLDAIAEAIINNADERYTEVKEIQRTLNSKYSSSEERSLAKEKLKALQEGIDKSYPLPPEGEAGVRGGLETVERLSRVITFKEGNYENNIDLGKKVHTSWARLQSIREIDPSKNNINLVLNRDYFEKRKKFNKCESMHNYNFCKFNKRHTKDLLDFLKENEDNYDEEDIKKAYGEDPKGLSVEDVENISNDELFADEMKVIGIYKMSDYHPEHIKVRIAILERRLEAFEGKELKDKREQYCEDSEYKGKFKPEDETFFFETLDKNMNIDASNVTTTSSTSTTSWNQLNRSWLPNQGYNDFNYRWDLMSQQIGANSNNLTQFAMGIPGVFGQTYGEWGSLFANQYNSFRGLALSPWETAINNGWFSNSLYNPTVTGNNSFHSPYVNYTPNGGWNFGINIPR